MTNARFAALLAAAVLAACGDKTVGPTGVTPTQPFGRMRFVNAVADAATADRVNVTVDGVPFGVSIAYAGVAPAPPTLYYPAYEGSRQVAVRRTADTSVKVLDQAVTIAANTDQTVFAIRRGGTVTARVVADDNSAPPAGNVKLRVIHLAPTAGNVDVYVTAPSANLTTATPTLTNVAPDAVSSYLTMPAGTYQVRFTIAGTKTLIAGLSVTTPALAAGAIRTVVALDPATGTTPTIALLTDR